jgi:hypothetical protein
MVPPQPKGDFKMFASSFIDRAFDFVIVAAGFAVSALIFIGSAGLI